MSADTRKVVASNTYFSLHTHSRYSVNDAMSGIGALVDQAVALGYPALGLTDHGTMAGVGQLYRLGKKAQLPVLPGIEMYLTPHHEAHTRSSMHLTMVAYTSVGYRNLVALSNQAQRQFYYRPRLDLADLAAAAEAGLTSGIAVATGCRSGPVVKSLTERGDPAGARQIVLALAAWFPRVYVELMDHGFTADGMWDYEINDALAAIACETGVPMILTGDAHYTLVADREDHDALKTLVSWSTEPDGGTFSGEGYWLMSQAEMAAKAVWQRYDVQTGLVELAAAAKVAIPELDTFTLKIPDVTLRGEQDIALGIKVKAGFARNMAHLLGPRRKRYQDRLDTELDVIAATGMAGYLLLVALITDYMERSDIWFHTRGSAAGSLACYVLGITQVDPIAEDIRMDRFLSGDRTSVPDVDLDIEHTKRDRVVAFLEGRGYELLQVGTQPVYGLDVRDNDESGEEKGSLRVKYFSTLRKQGIDIKGWAGVPAGDKATLARLADRGLIAGVGAHPGGYIIAKDAPTVAAIPMTKIASSGTTVTSWDKGEVEAAGFPKIDLLGSKALTGIRLCCEMVTGSQHAPTLDAPVGSSQAGADVWQSAKEYYRAIPRDDKATLKRCAEGHTVGLFQLGGWTQRRGVIDLKPKSTKDLIAAQALFRPAPLQSGFTKSYLRRRDKLDQVPDMHADISDETAGTYGIALYQEQVIGILRRIGLAPKDLTKMLKAVKSSGRAGEAAAKVAVAEEIDTIVAMATGRGWMPHDIRYLERALLDYGAGYSFGKAHSVTYGLVAYCTAFLATHEPLAYWTGMLNAYLGAKNSKGDKLEPFYIKAARTDEVRVRNPHVNHSGVAYLPEAGDGGLSIRTGLVSILGCGIGASNELVAKQPFRDLVDIGQRVTGKVSGAKDLLTGVPPAECKGVIAALFEAGALAGLAPGEPVVKAVTSRKRRCEECKITYATPIELTAHQASEHPEHQESA